MESIEQKKPLFSRETIEQAKQKIMSYSEYMELDPKPRFPDHFYVKEKGKEILFYQAKHSNDPSHPEFEEIPKLMQEFNPDKIFVELQGWINSKEDSPQVVQRKENIATWTTDKIIKEYGEPALTIHTALSQELSYSDIISPELSLEHLSQYLEKNNYPRENIFLFFVIKNLGTNFYRNHASISEDDLRKSCKTFGRIVNIPETICIDLFLKKHRELLGNEFENNIDHKTYHSLTAPLPNPDGTFGYFNKLSNIATRFRDETIIEKIANVLEKNDKLMIVYGGSHGTVQKPALEYLLHE